MQLTKEYFNRRHGLLGILVGKRLAGPYDEVNFIREKWPELSDDEVKDLRWVYGSVVSLCQVSVGNTILRLRHVVVEEANNRWLRK